MVWPKLLETSIGVIENANYLSFDQKRDILFNNAVRFFQVGCKQVSIDFVTAIVFYNIFLMRAYTASLTDTSCSLMSNKNMKHKDFCG